MTYWKKSSEKCHKESIRTSELYFGLIRGIIQWRQVSLLTYVWEKMALENGALHLFIYFLNIDWICRGEKTWLLRNCQRVMTRSGPEPLHRGSRYLFLFLCVHFYHHSVVERRSMFTCMLTLVSLLRHTGEPGGIVPQRQPQPAQPALWAGPVQQAVHYEHWKLSPQPPAAPDCGRGPFLHHPVPQDAGTIPCHGLRTEPNLMPACPPHSVYHTL